MQTVEKHISLALGQLNGAERTGKKRQARKGTDRNSTARNGRGGNVTERNGMGRNGTDRKESERKANYPMVTAGNGKETSGKGRERT